MSFGGIIDEIYGEGIESEVEGEKEKVIDEVNE